MITGTGGDLLPLLRVRVLHFDDVFLRGNSVTMRILSNTGKRTSLTDISRNISIFLKTPRRAYRM